MSQVWIEIKVKSGENGGQLRAYSAAMKAELERDGISRQLIWLGPDDPPDTKSARECLDGSLRWQGIHDAATRRRTHWLWGDLVLFLREIGMTEDRAFPISAREATVLEDARRLLLKSLDVLTPVNEWASKAIVEWPPDHWYPTANAVKGELLRKLIRSGDLVIKDGSIHPVYLRYGFAPIRGEACLVVRVEMASATDDELRSRVIDQFGPLLEGWSRPESGRVLLEVAERAVLFDRQGDAENWFKRHLTQLQKVGFYDFSCSAGGWAKYASHKSSQA